MMIEKKYKGVIVPMVTPINEDLSIDGDSVASIMKTFTLNDVSVFILGTTGESVSISEKQKNTLVKLTVEANNKKSMIYAGISGNSIQDTIDSARLYSSLGVDAVVAHLPFYYPVAPENMLRYFFSVADKIDCPLILYNNPMTVKWSIPLEIIDKLSYHPNIAGIKDSERGIDRVIQSIELWRNRTDFSYLLGWAAQSAFALNSGCDGIVPSTGNFVPDLYQKLYIAAKSGNMDDAMNLQKITDSFSELYQKDKTISEALPALKVLMAELGICKTFVFPPLYQSSPAKQTELREAFRNKINHLSAV